MGIVRVSVGLLAAFAHDAKKATPKNLFCVFDLRTGAPMINQGVGVGPGSAAHSISSTSGKESVQIGMRLAENIVATPYYCRWNLLIYFRVPNLLESKCSLPGFFWLGNNTIFATRIFWMFGMVAFAIKKQGCLKEEMGPSQTDQRP